MILNDTSAVHTCEVHEKEKSKRFTLGENLMQRVCGVLERDLIDYLISLGADINYINPVGKFTPYDHAAFTQDKDFLQWLLTTHEIKIPYIDDSFDRFIKHRGVVAQML